MNTGANRVERLSDYERAICYYTLPRITHPVTLGLLLAYAIVLLEAVLFLAWGAYTESFSWTTAGVVAVSAAVVLGIVAFTVRAIVNEVRKRKALATAEGVPDPRLSDHDLMPDPFGHHVLLRRPRNSRDAQFECTDREGNVQYTVERPTRRTWRVVRADGPPLELTADQRALSFMLEHHRAPAHVRVEEAGAPVAEIQLRYSLTKPTFTIRCHGAEEHSHEVRRRSIYKGDKVVGRVYYLRQYLYLDVERDEFHPGVLAYFVAIE